MPNPPSNPYFNLTRRSWLLWGVTLAVVLALTVSVPLLYFPLVQLADREGSPLIENASLAVVGLGGLIVVFCLYTVLKQIEINRMREALLREENEKQDIRTRLSELSALFQVSTTLNLQLRLEVILEIIVRRVVSTLKAQQASIMLYNPADGMLETRASYGLESEFARNAKKKLGEGIAGWVAERQEGVLLSPDRSPSDLQLHFKTNRNITSALSLPLRVGDRCVGVLNVNRINHPEPFLDHHRDILQLFAEHSGAVIERAGALERLNRRARELEEDNLRLNELNQMKDVFLSTASHELKTPLSSVIAYAELLEENDATLDRRQRGEFLHRLRGEAGRLLQLIEDILDLSRIESGKLTLRRRPIALDEIALAAVETSSGLARKHSVTLEHRLDRELPALSLDEVKMRQVIVNLLTNAIKFSPAGGVVRLATRRDQGDAVIEVTDHGPGIAPEESAHIFELFGQGVRDDAREAPGLGIGLHLVKRLSELHGGHVGVNSRSGSGSTFWVRLPLAIDASAAAKPDEVRPAA